MPTELCPRSGGFPDNFDGEFTRCPHCRRRLNLDPEGLIPRHGTVAKKGFINASEAPSDSVSLYPDRKGALPDE